MVGEVTTRAGDRSAAAPNNPDRAAWDLRPLLGPAVTRIGRALVAPASLLMVAEAATGVLAAVASVQLSRSIVVDPMSRVGQVSGVAGLDLRFVLLGLLVVGGCLLAGWRGGPAWAVTRRCACAAVAGLTTGLVAGGILLALRGTDWPLFANGGDSGQLLRWADSLLAGRGIPADYPPAVIHLIAWGAEWTGEPTARVLRALQVAGTALFGPAAYLAWRLLLRPGWALAVTLVAALPLLEPYKPYTTVVLVVLVPVLIGLLGTLRRVADAGWGRIVALGLGYGVALGLLFDSYSGWFVWSGPGVLGAALAVFPWRRGAARGVALLGVAGIGLVAVAAGHLFGILAAAGTVQDRFFYFDTDVDPAYIAMWRNDLPGNVGPWPPPGELAGVGVFVLLLVGGLGLGIAFGGRRTTVITLAALLAGAWLLRFWFASQAFATGAVQLYPRTSAEILYCLLLLSVFAVRYGAGWARGRLADPDRWRISPVAATVGGLCAALLLGLSQGSAVADRYQPRDDGSVGLLAYVAQMVRQPDGTCPDYGPNCAATTDELAARRR
jgi:hypothetical protein